MWRISKDQLRVLGATAPVPNLPEGPVLASVKADAALVNRVKTFLMEELPAKKSICARLGLVKYEGTTPDVAALEPPAARTAAHE